MVYMYIYTMEYYAAIKRNEILPFAMTWMELDGIMLSKISQPEKETIIWSPWYEEMEVQYGGQEKSNGTRWDREGDKP